MLFARLHSWLKVQLESVWQIAAAVPPDASDFDSRFADYCLKAEFREWLIGNVDIHDLTRVRLFQGIWSDVLKLSKDEGS